MFSQLTRIVLRALLARLILYHFVMVLGSLEFDADDVRQTGLHIRTLICTIQAIILSLFGLIIGFSRSVVDVIKRERHNFDRVRELPKYPDGTSDDLSLTGDNDASSMSSIGLDEVATEHIVFTHNNLDLYVLYVNFLGAVLWQTFVSFNFSTPYSNFCFICGLTSGWFAAQAVYDDNIHLQRLCTVRNSSLLICMIIVLFLASSQILVPDIHTHTLAVNTMLMAGSGCALTFLGSHMYFKSDKKQSSKGILYDSQRAMPSFFLVMTISALYSSPTSRTIALDYLSHLSRIALFHLLGLEPVIKAFAIYVLLMSLEKQNATDLLISIICALTTQICILTPITRDSFYLITLTCTVMCITHLFTQVNTDRQKTTNTENILAHPQTHCESSSEISQTKA